MPKRIKRSESEMFPLMARYSESGMTQSTFIEAEGLNKPVFQYWWRRYRMADTPKGSGDFVALEVNSEEVFDEASRLEPILVSGLRLRFTGQLPPKHYVLEMSASNTFSVTVSPADLLRVNSL